MLVSLALVLFIMVILSQALSIGLETFRQLKGTGELEEKLRMASTILRHDLTLDHFEGKRRLSDSSFWAQGPPREGFFHIEQGRFSTIEGVDGDNIPSIYATTHRLHFSIKLRGSQREDFLSAQVPPTSPLLDPAVRTTFFAYPADSRYQDTPNAYNSQWAEVAYFLLPNGATAGGTPLYGLYRRQRLAVSNNSDLNWGSKRVPLQQISGYDSMSCWPAKPANSLYFNNPTDLTVPERRFGMSRIPDPKNPGGMILVSNYTKLVTGEDLLLTDVISFSVRVLSRDLLNQQSSPAFLAFLDLLPLNTAFGTMEGSALRTPIGAFDTWSNVEDEFNNGLTSYYAKPAPLQIGINALQITLRVYDLKTQQTRQLTIVQDM
jgi:hypothetical protein